MGYPGSEPAARAELGDPAGLLRELGTDPFRLLYHPSVPAIAERGAAIGVRGDRCLSKKPNTSQAFRVLWSRLQGAATRFRRWLRSGSDERRSSQARERFWAQVREGEREAEASVIPPPLHYREDPL